jgi:hypothetical protein
MATKVSLGFGKSSDAELDCFAPGVIDALTGNAAYPTPPVTLANLQAARDDFTSKLMSEPPAVAGGQVHSCRGQDLYALIFLLLFQRDRI